MGFVQIQKNIIAAPAFLLEKNMVSFAFLYLFLMLMIAKSHHPAAPVKTYNKNDSCEHVVHRSFEVLFYSPGKHHLEQLE